MSNCRDIHISGRLAGGLALYYKSKYDNCVVRLQNDHQDVLWVKVNGPEMGHTSDVFISL